MYFFPEAEIWFLLGRGNSSDDYPAKYLLDNRSASGFLAQKFYLAKCSSVDIGAGDIVDFGYGGGGFKNISFSRSQGPQAWENSKRLALQMLKNDNAISLNYASKFC